MDHAFAVLQRGGQGLAQFGLVVGPHHQAPHRQFDGVFLEAVNPREARGGQELAIHPQVGVAAGTGPVGQLGVDPLAVDHQRGQQADVLTTELAQQLRGNAVGGLRLYRRAIVHAVLHPELHIKQAQKVPQLGGGAHGGLAPAARQTLLDRHRGGDAVDRVHLGAAGRLHDAAGIGIEAFEVATLALVEQDVEGQGGFTRAADPCHHAELAARNVDRQALQVVLAGIHDLDRIRPMGWRLAARAHQGLQRRALLDRMRPQAHGPVVFAQRLAGV